MKSALFGDSNGPQAYDDYTSPFAVSVSNGWVSATGSQHAGCAQCTFNAKFTTTGAAKVGGVFDIDRGGRFNTYKGGYVADKD